jgi:hypothetical protein
MVESDGKRGIVYDEAPEAEALRRWQQGEFLSIERDFAKRWREGLKAQRIRRLDITTVERPRDLAAAKRQADAWVRQPGGPPFLAALNAMGVPESPRGAIFARWLDAGAPPIAAFAPYAAYIATVQFFFYISVSFDLISDARASNAADIAYLYYLPFCMVFTSSDKLHAKTAPLFLRPGQEYVPGADLKADLKRLDAYLSAQPQEVLDRGLMYVEPPTDGHFLTTRLWMKFLPGFRARGGERRDFKSDPERSKTLVAEFSRALKAPETRTAFDPDDAAFVSLHRVVPVKMGKWRILPEDVVQRYREHQRRERDAKPPETPQEP